MTERVVALEELGRRHFSCGDALPRPAFIHDLLAIVVFNLLV